MKKNNLFKISLLLLVLNFSNIYTNREIIACQKGMNARAASQGATLMRTGDESLSDDPSSLENRTCNNSFTKLIERAACIYGYNNNWPSYQDSTTSNYHGKMDGNGCGTPWTAIEFNSGICPSWFGYSYPGGNNPCCVNGWDACEYGKEIGWNLSVQNSSEKSLKFYKKFGKNTDLLPFFWGTRTRPYTTDATNWNNLILKSFLNVNKNGDQDINSPEVLAEALTNKTSDLGIS